MQFLGGLALLALGLGAFLWLLPRGARSSPIPSGHPIIPVASLAILFIVVFGGSMVLAGLLVR